MKILVATHNYPRFRGDPAGAFVQRLALGATAAGHEVVVVAPHAAGLPLEERQDGLTVRRFRYAPESLERVAYRGDLHVARVFSGLVLLGVPAFLGAFSHALHRAARALRPDVVHAHWWLPAGWLATRLGVPTIVTSHGSDIRLLDRSALVRRFALRVLSRARLVTTVSDFLNGDLRTALPSLATPVATMPMPLDVAHFARGRATPRADPPRILYAGNVLESKGVDVLIEAFARLRARGVVCRLRILGEGPYRDAAQRLARDLGVAAEVDWSDFVGQEAMPAEYGAATVTVLPTRGAAEGLGLALAEAALAGSAVVGTPAGGIPEVIADERTGLIAADGDADDLARQIERMLIDPELRARLQSRAAIEMEARFAPDRAVGRFLEAYVDVAGHVRAARRSA